jgi:hypothetical protein
MLKTRIKPSRPGFAVLTLVMIGEKRINKLHSHRTDRDNNRSAQLADFY